MLLDPLAGEIDQHFAALLTAYPGEHPVLHLRLELHPGRDLQLLRLPWELLHEHRLTKGDIHVARYILFDAVPGLPAPAQRLRVLVLESDPAADDLPRLHLRERDEIAVGLSDTPFAARVAIEPVEPAGYRALQMDIVPAVIAIPFPLETQAAEEFARLLYQFLRRGLPLADALHRVQQDMTEPYPDEWDRPVLYLRSRQGDGGRLLNTGAAGNAPETVGESRNKAGQALKPDDVRRRALQQSALIIDAAARVQSEQQVAEIDRRMETLQEELDRLALAPPNPARRDDPGPDPSQVHDLLRERLHRIDFRRVEHVIRRLLDGDADTGRAAVDRHRLLAPPALGPTDRGATTAR
jgi:hypothetical protein